MSTVGTEKTKMGFSNFTDLADHMQSSRKAEDIIRDRFEELKYSHQIKGHKLSLKEGLGKKEEELWLDIEVENLNPYQSNIVMKQTSYLKTHQGKMFVRKTERKYNLRWVPRKGSDLALDKILLYSDVRLDRYEPVPSEALPEEALGILDQLEASNASEQDKKAMGDDQRRRMLHQEQKRKIKGDLGFISFLNATYRPIRDANPLFNFKWMGGEFLHIGNFRSWISNFAFMQNNLALMLAKSDEKCVAKTDDGDQCDKAIDGNSWLCPEHRYSVIDIS